MATTSRAPTCTSLRLLRAIELTKSLASKPRGPQTLSLPLLVSILHQSAHRARSKQARPTRPNLHSLNSRSAVSCNEGFCNAPERQRLTSTAAPASQKPHRYANDNPTGLTALIAIAIDNFRIRDASLHARCDDIIFVSDARVPMTENATSEMRIFRPIR
jgi:hypothetical protein